MWFYHLLAQKIMPETEEIARARRTVRNYVTARRWGRIARSSTRQVVGIGTLLTEGEVWGTTLGERTHLVTSLGSIPVFTGPGAGERQGVVGLSRGVERGEVCSA